MVVTTQAKKKVGRKGIHLVSYIIVWVAKWAIKHLCSIFCILKMKELHFPHKSFRANKIATCHWEGDFVVVVAVSKFLSRRSLCLQACFLCKPPVFIGDLQDLNESSEVKDRWHRSLITLPPQLAVHLSHKILIHPSSSHSDKERPFQRQRDVQFHDRNLFFFFFLNSTLIFTKATLYGNGNWIKSFRKRFHKYCGAGVSRHASCLPAKPNRCPSQVDGLSLEDPTTFFRDSPKPLFPLT